jgi:hypothetical protein
VSNWWLLLCPLTAFLNKQLYSIAGKYSKHADMQLLLASSLLYSFKLYILVLSLWNTAASAYTWCVLPSSDPQCSQSLTSYGPFLLPPAPRAQPH